MKKLAVYGIKQSGGNNENIPEVVDVTEQSLSLKIGIMGGTGEDIPADYLQKAERLAQLSLMRGASRLPVRALVCR